MRYHLVRTQSFEFTAARTRFFCVILNNVLIKVSFKNYTAAFITLCIVAGTLSLMKTDLSQLNKLLADHALFVLFFG